MDDTQLRKVFERFDTDGSGFIERDEMIEAVKHVCKKMGLSDDVAVQEADAIINESNEVGEADNKISFEEFCLLFRKP